MSLRLLCVTAHPDDECFAFGGALALAHQQGVEISVLCFTDGQAATNRGEARSNEELGRMRRAEFKASCQVLGIDHQAMLAYQDADLENHSLHELGGVLVERMRAFQPHVVLTFGGEGALNNHPDHTTVSLATTAAFHWSGNPARFPEIGTPWRPQRLWLLTADHALPDRLAPLPAPWSCVLDTAAVADIRFRACEQHTSQNHLMPIVRSIAAEHGHLERFTLAYTTRPQPVALVESLFEGVSEDDLT